MVPHAVGMRAIEPLRGSVKTHNIMPPVHNKTFTTPNRSAFSKLPRSFFVALFRLIHWQFEISDRTVVRFLSVICSVCNLWRYTALQEPMLWTNIVYHDRYDFPANKKTNGLPPNVEARIRAYLLRSTNRKLSVHLNFGDSRRGVGHMKNILHQHLHPGRCSQLVLNFESDKHVDRFLPLTNCFTELPRVDCRVRSGGIYKRISQHNELYGWKPKVSNPIAPQKGSIPRPAGLPTKPAIPQHPATALTNSATHMRKGPVTSSIPKHIIAEALTELHVSRVSWECAMMYLPQCQALRQLKLTMHPCEGKAVPPFTLPHLIHLEAPTLDFSMTMHTPELRSLVLKNGFEEEDRLVPPPLPSWRKLHTLRLLRADPSRLDVIALLRANPTIKVLEIGWCHTEENTLGEFDRLMEEGGPNAVIEGTNKTVTRKKGKKHGAPKKKVEFGNMYNTFLPSLRYLKFDVLFYIRAEPIGEEWASHWLKHRPELRFDGDDRVVCDGAKVDPVEMDLIIKEYPRDGGHWRTFV